MTAAIPLYIKTAYQDEPSYASTKVVTSLYAKSIKNDLGDNFKKSLEFRDAKAELLEAYKDNFDFEELAKLSIDYSDGIIKASPEVNDQLLKYATDKKVPVLGYEEDFADGYEAFYDQICPSEE